MERPASPWNRKGSSEKESWSAVEDRIHGWWQPKRVTVGFREKSLGRESQQNPDEDGARATLTEDQCL